MYPITEAINVATPASNPGGTRAYCSGDVMANMPNKTAAIAPDMAAAVIVLEGLFTGFRA